MAKQLIIGSKTYHPTTFLSGRFSYTSDYLSKLAREGKVEASRVGRQWFIEESSLESFLQKVATEKKERADALRKERQQERKEFEDVSEVTVRAKTAIVKQNFVGPTVALAQAFAIVMCGYMFGALGFFAYEENIQPIAFATAANETVEMVKDAVLVDAPDLENIDQLAAVDFSSFLNWFFYKKTVVQVENNSPVNQAIVSKETSLPESGQDQVPSTADEGLIILQDDFSKVEAEKVRKSFSDQVEIEFEGTDTGVIKPVFKNRTDESYRFLMVPLTHENE